MVMSKKKDITNDRPEAEQGCVSMFGEGSGIAGMCRQATLNAYLHQAISDNPDRVAFANFKGEQYTFGQVSRHIARLHVMFEAMGLRAGDRVSLCARNSAEWAIASVAVLAYGAVGVPILNDFDAETIRHLISHSRSRLLFADGNTLKRIGEGPVEGLENIVDVSGFAIVSAKSGVTADDVERAFEARYGDGFDPSTVRFADVAPEALALINYTSGSTGFSKGVMLSERALWSNLQFCIDGLTYLHPGDRMLSMLPLAHMFGFMIEMVHPFAKGCETTFLNRTPSPKILLDAFASVRPKLIITVPLVIEKIVRTRIFPVLKRPLMRFVTAIPGLRGLVYRKVRRQMIAAFGGDMRQIIVGGAALSEEVEPFLRKIKFPLTVGYGMTECGPLISYCEWSRQRPGSCGLTADRMEVRVDSADPVNIPGVLWVRGDNVMDGYYRNPEATDAVFSDGWMNTGDICTVDADGYIYIRGRDKNMILGPSGQNIYPEEIEQKLNVMPLVSESIVIDAGNGRLEALIHPDYDAAGRLGLTDEAIKAQLERDIADVNGKLPVFARISGLSVMHDEFEKTPKKSIKRYLYLKGNKAQ